MFRLKIDFKIKVYLLLNLKPSFIKYKNMDEYICLGPLQYAFLNDNLFLNFQLLPVMEALDRHLRYVFAATRALHGWTSAWHRYKIPHFYYLATTLHDQGRNICASSRIYSHQEVFMT